MDIFKYLREKLQITELQQTIKNLPSLNDRYLKMLNPMENLYSLLLEPEGDDSLVMHKLRCMGLCGGWKIKEQYEKGRKHGFSEPKENS